MKGYTEKEKGKKYPSLYDAFDLGDRVIRNYKEKLGKKKEYRGIVLAIDKKGLEIYWDKQDGKYRPEDMNIGFTHCELEEIYNGNDGYSPIKKVKN